MNSIAYCAITLNSLIWDVECHRDTSGFFGLGPVTNHPEQPSNYNGSFFAFPNLERRRKLYLGK